MSAAVTGAGATAPFTGAAFDAVSVCAQAPAVNAVRIRAVRNRFLLDFMEVQSSPFRFVLALLLRGGDNRKPLAATSRCGLSCFRAAFSLLPSRQPVP